MAEYINMITVSAVASTVFLGGWSLFGLGINIPGLSIIFFLIKVAFFLFMFIWLRATLPRIRYDRLMRLGWQMLLPLAALNVVITAVVVALGWPWWVNGIAGLAVVVVVLFAIRQRSVTEGTRFEEDIAKGALVLPSSVRLAKFERPAAAAPASTSEEGEQVQEQDAKAVVRQ